MSTPRPTPETDAESINGAHHPQFVFSDFARELERERDEMREELQQWKMLCAWGGTPEHIDQFIKGQQSRIHQAQDIEETCEQLERERNKACKHLAAANKGAEINAHINHSLAAKLAEAKRELNEAREQLEAMREAIREAGHILGYYRKFTPALVDLPEDIWLETVEGKQVLSALAKLQPFLKP